MLALVGGAVTVGLCGVGYGYDSGFLPIVPFDSAKWRQGSEDGSRIAMIETLTRSRRLMGRSRAEIEALLGPPDETSYFSDWDMVYWLGDERGFIRIDSEWLVLRLGANDEVTEWSVVRD